MGIYLLCLVRMRNQQPQHTSPEDPGLEGGGWGCGVSVLGGLLMGMAAGTVTYALADFPPYPADIARQAAVNGLGTTVGTSIILEFVNWLRNR